MNERCHCGLELHYTDPELQKRVEAIVARFGPFIEVWDGERIWRVQRHYIALHGIRDKDLSKLNFREASHEQS